MASKIQPVTMYKVVHKHLVEDEDMHSYANQSAILCLKWMQTNERAGFMHKYYCNSVEVTEDQFMQYAQDEAHKEYTANTTV